MGPCSTVKPERTGVGRWTYVAAKTEEWLKAAALGKYVSPKEFPARVFTGAREFLLLARDAFGEMQRGTHPPQGEGAAAYAAACNALECVCVERKSRRSWLRRGSQFLTGAKRAHRLANEEALFAAKLAQFFGHIKQEGERARYAQAMAEADDE